KIGPLKALYEKVDHLILGGLMYNTFISAKYGASIRGVSEEDRALAMELVEIDRKQNKIVEMDFLVESENMEKKAEGQFRTISLDALKNGETAGYLLDVDPKSYRDEKVSGVIASAGTFFVNAVMGLMPSFWEGSEALYRMIAANRSARKLFAGGDTVQELRNLCPGIYMSGLDDPNTYYFTGGGAVLSAIEQGTPYDMKPIQALFQEI
ncbi:MAG TPA: phosphoglycerate kinase, partial [Deltaproteobacteria bacterium]|nr:phosphoglycerate kinase [Deltaproteobacteria bacterium]